MLVETNKCGDQSEFQALFFFTLESKVNWGVVWLFCTALLSGLSLPLQVINSPACLFFSSWLLFSFHGAPPHSALLSLCWLFLHMVKINSPSGLLTSANSLFGKLCCAPSNPLLKKCYYNGVDLIANKPVQSLPLLDIVRKNSLCLWIYSHRQDISTLRPAGYQSTANEQTALPQLVVCEINIPGYQIAFSAW